MAVVPGDLDVHGRSRHPYGGPLVILVNDWSASAAELFACGMLETGRATIVGQQTVGAVLGFASFAVEGGGRLGVSVLDIRTSKGQRLEDTGVLPDRAVPVTLKDLRSNRDAALAAAIEILKAAAKTAPATAMRAESLARVGVGPCAEGPGGPMGRRVRRRGEARALRRRYPRRRPGCRS